MMAYDSLISWLTAQGGYVGPCEVRETPIRGLVTTKGVAAGEPLVAVPRACSIRSMGDDSLRPVEELVLTLIRERELGESSEYAPYLASLPKHVPLLRDWSEKQYALPYAT